MSYFLVDWRKLIDSLYLIGLGMLLVSLPIFNLGMSVSLFWVSGVWFLDFLHDVFVVRNPWQKFRRFWSNRWAVLLSSLLVLHAIGMFHTEDINYGLRDLRIKVPLFIIPFVLASFPPLSKRSFKTLIHFFIAAVTFSVVTNLMVYWDWVHRDLDDIRDISKSFISRISHIRLSLMCALVITICGHRIFSKKQIIVHALVAVANIYFLWVVESITGLSVLALAVVAYLLFWSIKNWQLKLARTALMGGLAIVVFGCVFIGINYNRYHSMTDYIDLENLPTHTAGGEAYDHNLENLQIENGHYVWLFVAWDELESGWSEKSDLDVYDNDANGQPLYGTLIRYMTSKGLLKDATGVATLTEEDVLKIEAGVSSILEGQRTGISGRLDKIFLELDLYANGGDPSGHSLTQRLEFWRAGTNAFADDWLFGAGTGDIGLVMQQSYADIDSRLSEGSRLRIHNQFLSFAVAFGIVGFIWVGWVLIYPLRKGYARDFLFFMFYIMALTSFLTEDTIESQAGVGYFVYLIGVLSIARKLPLNEVETA